MFMDPVHVTAFVTVAYMACMFLLLSGIVIGFLYCDWFFVCYGFQEPYFMCSRSHWKDKKSVTR